MRATEYAYLMGEINLNYKVTNDFGKKIKYVTAHYDNRDGEVYLLRFREWFSSEWIEFNINFDNGNGKLTYNNIIKWLKEE